MGYKTSFVSMFVFVIIISGYEASKKTTEQCSKDSDCDTMIPHTICVDNNAFKLGVCSCTREYVLRQRGNLFDCLEEAKLFEDSCQIDDQCKPKFGEEAACINNKCKCSPGAHFDNFLCRKSSKLGETCGDSNNCATRNSQCSGICRCLPGFVGNSANTKCLKVAQHIGDHCEDSVQCRPVNSLASCQFQVCLCPFGYNTQGTNCIKQQVSDPPRKNNATRINDCFAMIIIAFFLFCFKI